MLRLRDIMTTELVTVSPDLSLRDTIELFVKEHVSGAPVVAQHKVVGVVSVSDLIAFVASLPDMPQEDRVDRGWEELESDSESDTEEQPAAAWFVKPGNDEALEIVERFTDAEMRWTERDRFAQHTVAEVMTPDIRALPASTPVDQAADFMRQAAIHRVLVMSNDVLEGIVSMKDISDAVADHKLTARTYVFGPPASYPPGKPTRHST
jgi:CBS domain-containing protein